MKGSPSRATFWSMAAGLSPKIPGGAFFRYTYFEAYAPTDSDLVWIDRIT